MSMNETPRANRIHIGIFGKRNAGKSSVINAITGQNLAIVSDVQGTTTDPVLKAMELLPLGPVVMIDTPGIDDVGELGQLRIEKSYQMLNKTDIAVIVLDANGNITEEDERVIHLIQSKNIPYIVVLNKLDETHNDIKSLVIYDELKKIVKQDDKIMGISAKTGENIWELKEAIAHLNPKEIQKPIVKDLVEPGDIVVLVVPIDSAAPKGRLILPQQQTIRELLDTNCISVVVQDTELKDTLSGFTKKPKLVITDSQAFEKVSQETPKDIMLTSFSILFARHKGNLKTAVEGARVIDSLENEDRVLISEGCTHHRQCDDIGTVKLPNWLKKYTKKELRFDFTSGTEFPLNLRKYKLIIHCGGCTLNEREMKYRMKCAKEQNVPITNYGTAISYMNGILERSIEIFNKPTG